MKALLEQEDIEKIAQAVCEMLKPMLNQSKAGDVIFDKKQLASYLNISQSAINKLIVNKQIPYIKLNGSQAGGVRFSKNKIDKWLDQLSIPNVNPLHKALFKK